MKLREIKLIPPVAAISVMLLALTSFGATRNFYWTGDNGTQDLSDPLNWDGDMLPTADANDCAYVVGSGTDLFSLYMTGDLDAGSLYFKSTANMETPIDVDLRDHALYTTNASSIARGLFFVNNKTTLRNGTINATRIICGGTISSVVYPETEVVFSNATVVLPATSWWSMGGKTRHGVTLLDSCISKLTAFTPNSEVVLDNSTANEPYLNGAGDGSFLHLRNGSVFNGFTGNPGLSRAHIVVEGGSTFGTVYGGAGGFWLGKAGTKSHDSVMALTNSTLWTTRFYVCGTNDELRLHNSVIDFSGNSDLYLNGFGNKLIVTGSDVTFTNRHQTYFGTNTRVSIADNVAAVFRLGFQTQTSTNCVFSVGTNASVQVTTICTKTSTKDDVDASSGNRYEIGRDSVFHFNLMTTAEGKGYGLCGQSNVWQVVGEVRIDRGADIGTYKTSNGCRLELLGDDARFLCGLNVGGSTGHMTIGNAENADSISILFKPGPNGFNGEAPLSPRGYSFGEVNLIDANIEVDLRDFYTALPASTKPYRLPLMQTGIHKNMNVTNLESLQAKAKICPVAGKFVVDGRMLYLEFEKKPGLMILVR